MLRSQIAIRSLTLLTLALAASCGSDSPTAPSPDEVLGTALAQTALADANSYAEARGQSMYVTSMVSDSVLAGATPPAFDPATCPYSSADQRFVCPTVISQGFTFTLTYTLMDAQGTAQSAYDPATTDRLATDLNASLVLGGATGERTRLHRHSQMTLTGLLGDTRIINGTVVERDTVVTGSGNSQMTQRLNATVTAANVMIPAGRTDYPTSGVITGTFGWTGTLQNAGSSASWTTTLTFNGTKLVPLSVVTNNAHKDCTVDLTGAAAPSCTTT